ncbi:hypothetical protein JOC74_004697 [Bacillus capparidis]|uniref:Uncharacterized protein n=1 Tax=Bacillus capparidis TaxID=1840411 RepID=A0ABS4D3E7_9BACI|nr:hypothetical protein [Bacillus capparidis]
MLNNHCLAVVYFFFWGLYKKMKYTKKKIILNSLKKYKKGVAQTFIEWYIIIRCRKKRATAKKLFKKSLDLLS